MLARRLQWVAVVYSKSECASGGLLWLPERNRPRQVKPDGSAGVIVEIFRNRLLLRFDAEQRKAVAAIIRKSPASDLLEI